MVLYSIWFHKKPGEVTVSIRLPVKEYASDKFVF